ncbi:hypothetical protein R676_24120 [Salmonella enterica subsp. enterica serovar Typhimurium]|nr:hypothetical protein [Salmonella enterica subsp. enterica serovar Typhimurium]EDZ8972201.1 hypothetical protein [Salmonella enterica subsp. enterica serovar Typhimurium]
MLCHGTVCVVGKIRDLILQLSKSSIYSTKPFLAAKIIKTARYVIMKLSENYPYKGVYEKCLV